MSLVALSLEVILRVGLIITCQVILIELMVFDGRIFGRRLVIVCGRGETKSSMLMILVGLCMQSCIYSVAGIIIMHAWKINLSIRYKWESPLDWLESTGGRLSEA
jgi:hypothetical protein